MQGSDLISGTRPSRRVGGRTKRRRRCRRQLNSLLAAALYKFYNRSLRVAYVLFV